MSNNFNSLPPYSLKAGPSAQVMDWVKPDKVDYPDLKVLGVPIKVFSTCDLPTPGGPRGNTVTLVLFISNKVL